MVRLLERRAEDGHHPVAEIGDERAAVVEDGLAHLAEVVVEDLDHLLGRARLREGREAAQVGEHHRARADLAAEAQPAAGLREHLVDDLLRDEAGEEVADPLPLERSSAARRTRSQPTAERRARGSG